MNDIAVMNHLLADANITAIVGDNIWAAWLPESATMPAITVNYASESPIETLGGSDAKTRETITINCWANNKQDAINILTEIKQIMSGFAVRLSMLDLSELEQGIYRYAIDYSVFG